MVMWERWKILGVASFYLEMVFWGRIRIMMGKWNATVSRNAHHLNRIKQPATSPQHGF